MIFNILYFLIFSSSLFCAQESTTGKLEKPLDCVTHIAGIQKIIADYCDQEWVQVTELPAKDIIEVTCSPDGKYIACALWKKRGGDLSRGIGSTQVIENSDTNIEIWNSNTGKACTVRVPVNSGDIVSMEFVPKSNYLAVANNRVWFIDICTQKCFEIDTSGTWITEQNKFKYTPNHGYFTGYYNIGLISFSFDSNYLVTATDTAVNLQKKNSSSITEIVNGFHDFKVLFTPDNSKLLIAGSKKRLLVYNLVTGALNDIQLDYSAHTIIWTCIPGSDAVALAGGQCKNNITIQNVNTGAKILYDKIGFSINALAALSEKYIAAGTQKGDIIIYDISNYEEDMKTGIAMPAKIINSIAVPVGIPHGHDSSQSGRSVKSLHCSVDGKYLTAEFKNGVIKRWVNLAHYLVDKYKLKE